MFFSNYKIVPNSIIAHFVVHALKITGVILAPVRHRGFWRVARLLGKLVHSDQRCIVHLTKEARFEFNLSDPYWSRVVSQHFCYEPEIKFVLTLMKDLDFTFLDCGANYGYWSVICASPEIGCSNIVAIEANSETFNKLKINQELNNNRFSIRKNALYSCDGQHFQIDVRGDNHAGASIITDKDSNTNGGVESVTLDTLVSENGYLGKYTIAKLDVEGVEIEALKGGTELLKSDCLIIYEDHGKDKQSSVTDFVLNELGLSVFYIDHNFAVRPINSVSDANGLKTRNWKGYNFFATQKNSPTANRLTSLCSFKKKLIEVTLREKIKIKNNLVI